VIGSEGFFGVGLALVSTYFTSSSASILRLSLLEVPFGFSSTSKVLIFADISAVISTSLRFFVSGIYVYSVTLLGITFYYALNILATVGYFNAPSDFSFSFGFEFPPKFSLVYF
jgi:hypothetical protein